MYIYTNATNSSTHALHSAPHSSLGRGDGALDLPTLLPPCLGLLQGSLLPRLVHSNRDQGNSSTRIKITINGEASAPISGIRPGNVLYQKHRLRGLLPSLFRVHLIVMNKVRFQKCQKQAESTQDRILLIAPTCTNVFQRATISRRTVPFTCVERSLANIDRSPQRSFQRQPFFFYRQNYLQYTWSKNKFQGQKLGYSRHCQEKQTPCGQNMYIYIYIVNYPRWHVIFQLWYNHHMFTEESYLCCFTYKYDLDFFIFLRLNYGQINSKVCFEMCSIPKNKKKSPFVTGGHPEEIQLHSPELLDSGSICLILAAQKAILGQESQSTTRIFMPSTLQSVGQNHVFVSTGPCYIASCVHWTVEI